MDDQRQPTNPWVALWKTTVTGAVAISLIGAGAAVLFAGLAFEHGGAQISYNGWNITLPARVPPPIADPPPTAFLFNPAVPAPAPPPPPAPPVPSIVTAGEPVVPFLGIWYTGDTRLINSETGLTELYGARVRSVIPDSPAEAEGLQPGDLITAVDGQSLLDRATLRRIVRGADVGRTITLEVYRDDRPLRLRVRLAGRTIAEEPERGENWMMPSLLRGSWPRF